MSEEMTAPTAQISNILERFMRIQRITVSELARRTNLPQPVLYRIVCGDTEDPRLKTLRRIAQYFGISISQLIGDEPLDFEQMTGARGQVHARLLPLLQWDDLSAWPNNRTSLPFSVAYEQSGDQFFALKMNDGSMRPSIPEHAVLILQQNLPLNDHDFALIRLGNGQHFFRQVLFDHNTLRLKPLNPDYAVREISEPYEVVGVLIQNRIELREPVISKTPAPESKTQQGARFESLVFE